MDRHLSRTIGDIDLTGSSDVPTPSAGPVLTAEAPAGAALADLQERLARVERLLEADLAVLGPSVVAASIDELLSRVDAVAARVDEVGHRLAAPSAAAVPAAGGRVLDGGGDLDGVVRRLDSIDRRVDRLTLLVEAATAPLEEGEEGGDPALRRIEQALVGLTVVVQRIAAIAEDADAAG